MSPGAPTVPVREELDAGLAGAAARYGEPELEWEGGEARPVISPRSAAQVLARAITKRIAA